jgi:hypothetical protein
MGWQSPRRSHTPDLRTGLWREPTRGLSLRVASDSRDVHRGKHRISLLAGDARTRPRAFTQGGMRAPTSTNDRTPCVRALARGLVASPTLVEFALLLITSCAADRLTRHAISQDITDHGPHVPVICTHWLHALLAERAPLHVRRCPRPSLRHMRPALLHEPSAAPWLPTHLCQLPGPSPCATRAAPPRREDSRHPVDREHSSRPTPTPRSSTRGAPRVERAARLLVCQPSDITRWPASRRGAMSHPRSRAAPSKVRARSRAHPSLTAPPVLWLAQRWLRSRQLGRKRFRPRPDLRLLPLTGGFSGFRNCTPTHLGPPATAILRSHRARISPLRARSAAQARTGSLV